FRQSFFANIVAGTGFSGQVFANVTATGAVGTNFTSSATGQTISNLSVGGGGGGGAGGVGAVGGYLGMIQELQQIRNVEDNIRRTEEQLRVLRARASQRPREIAEPLEALPAGLQLPPHIAQRLSYNADEKLLVWRGELNDTLSRELMELSDDPAFQEALREIIARGTAETININIAQLETNLANQIISLYTNQRQLQDLYDNFKIGIGVPTDMVINVDDTMLKQFQFMDPTIIALQDVLTRYISAFEEIDDEDPDLEQLRSAARGLAEVRDQARVDGLQLVASDFKQAADNFSKRLEALPEADRERVRRDAVRDRQLFLNVVEGFKETDERLNTILDLLQSDTLPLASRRHALRELSDLREDYLLGVQSLSVVQIDLRLELISLIPFKMSIEDVMGIALANRQDLMNARAQVMDARRKIEVAANQLEATVNLVANGDIRTKTNAMLNQNPFDFRGKLSTFQAGVSFTTPIQLVVARNNYRAAMIFYEQARRNYMLTEDQVKQSVRVAWRQLHFLDLNFEQARISMRMSALQYDQAVEQTAAPVAPTGQPPGLNLLNALNAILNAQNALINIWVNYEANRLAIYRDMGTMELDDDGFWTDEYYQSLRTNRAPAASPPAGLPPEALPPEAPPATSDVESQEPDPHALPEPLPARVSLQPKSARIRLAAAEEEAEPVRTVTRDNYRRAGGAGRGGNRSRRLEWKTLEVAP
ncbi:MAG TPA: TolC family protein, partial [Planctomycetaceae bacterium]|nr:TolC family protein [Planctomycetaceae bacterium]